MNHIENFFSKLKSSFASENNKKEIIAAACLEKGKTKIEISQIEVQGPVIKLSISPAAKSAIFMKKAAILEDLAQKIKPVPFDIR